MTVEEYKRGADVLTLGKAKEVHGDNLPEWINSFTHLIVFPDTRVAGMVGDMIQEEPEHQHFDYYYWRDRSVMFTDYDTMVADFYQYYYEEDMFPTIQQNLKNMRFRISNDNNIAFTIVPHDMLYVSEPEWNDIKRIAFSQMAGSISNNIKTDKIYIEASSNFNGRKFTMYYNMDETIKF